MAAIDDLNALLSPLPGSEKITPLMKTSALAQALIPDAAGVWPGRTGYVSTYDVYFAATTLIPFLQAQPFVRQVSSEGTSVATDAPSWGALLQSFASLSPILSRQSAVLTAIPIPMESHVVKLNMEGGDSYGDIDTDVS